MKKSHSHLRFAVRSIAAALILLLLLGQNPNARAASVSAGFQFDFDQNLIMLDGTANIRNLEAAIAGGATGLQESLDIAMSTDYALAAMWRPYTNVLLGRRYPGLLLSNDTSSNANIVGVEISLENSSNQFMPFFNGDYIVNGFASGEYKLFGAGTSSYQRVDPDQVSMNASVFDGGQRLSVSFGNGGIQPGRATTFNIYSSTGTNLEDFLDDNSLIEVTYQDSDTGDLVSTGQLQLSNIKTFNDGLMAQVMTGLAPGTPHFASSVESFSLEVPVSLIGIPEPSSLFLLSSALGLFSLRRRRVSCGA